AAIPGGITGVGWSDHWAFWHEGYPGMMVTDTGPFRYPFYHTVQDTPDKIRYDQMARVVKGLEGVVDELATVPLL
ncbi:MAG: M28 family peptidase, partial [Candidatus Methylomirabilales bacterium]